MAITVGVQNEKFPYLARQINGDVALALGYGIDYVYEADAEFLDFLSHFSIDTLYGEWLDKLGIIIGFPRPYTTEPTNSFLFDSPDFLLDGKLHGLSTDEPIIIDGVEYDRNDGGILSNIYQSEASVPINDSLYKKYIYAITLLRNTHSLKNMADVIEQFIDSTRYAITFKNEGEFVNDIIIYVAATAGEYRDSLQIAFNKVFTTPPFVLIDVSIYFDDLYTVPEIERIIADITGTDTGYTVVYSIENKMAVFTITLDPSLAEYEEEIRLALEVHFASASDVIIIVQVE
jgi:hypothetical protein